MHIRTRAAVVTALVLIVSLVAVPVGAATAQLGAVTVEGDAVVQTDANETYLWQSEPFAVNTSFATDAGGVYQFCLEAHPDDNESERLTCHSQSIEDDTTTPVSFTLDNVSEREGQTQLTVSVTESFNSSSATVNRSISVTVITKEGDFDGDGLENRAEVRYGTEMNGTDTDDDTLQDGPEVLEYNTSPTQSDTDGDGLSDDAELRAGSNPREPDTDGDGLIDGQEDDLGTDPTTPDTDGDGLSDGEEVHKYGTDPTTPDTDGDGLPDDQEIQQGTAPDNSEADSDGDGLSDTEEAELGTNASKADSDGDLLSDSTEVSLGTDPNDPSTLLVLVAGVGFLVVGLVGFFRVFGPDDIRAWVAERDVVSRVATLTATDAATNGSDVTTGGSSLTASPSSAAESTASADVAGTTAAADSEVADDDQLPFDLSDPLTDEDEVLKLLYEADGRLRQSEINNSTEWSKSKVSRLLSSMEDDGKIRKITIGRENLVTLADRVPQSAESPFDEDDTA